MAVVAVVVSSLIGIQHLLQVQLALPVVQVAVVVDLTGISLQKRQLQDSMELTAWVAVVVDLTHVDQI